MVESMKPGSVIVDLAAERGGNVEGTMPSEITGHKSVTIIGFTDMAGRVPGNASSLYARNLYAFIEPLIDKKEGKLAIKWDDEIVAGTLIAKDGQIVNARLRTA
jgi:NAD(P) transhydrogenase subunit alpha